MGGGAPMSAEGVRVMRGIVGWAPMVLVLVACLGGCDDRQQSGADPDDDAAVPEGVCAFLVCDDGDRCTTDTCAPEIGCVHTPSPVLGCGPACQPTARPRGVLMVPGRGIGLRVVEAPGHLYRAAGAHLEIYSAPLDGAVTPIGGVWMDSRILDLERVGDRLYAAAGAAGLRVYDIADPASPRLLGGHPSADTATALRVVDDVAYVAERAAGLRIYDVSEPGAITEIGALDTAGYPYRLDVNPERQLVAIGGDVDLVLVDVGALDRPVERAELSPPGTILAGLRFVPGTSLLHVDQSSLGAYLYDLSDLDAPMRSRMPHRGVLGPARPEGVYALEDNEAIRLLEFSAADDVSTLMEWPLPEFTYYPGFTIAEGRPLRAVMTGVGRFDVYPLGDGALGAPIAAFADAGQVHDLELAGDRVFIADDRGGLRAIDVSDPDRPVLVEPALAGVSDDAVRRVAADADRLVFTQLNDGLAIHDIAAARAWPLLDRLDLERSADAIALAGDALWVADFDAIQLYRVEPAGLRLDLALPTERPVRAVTPLTDPGRAAIAFADALAIVDARDGELRVLAELSWRARPEAMERVGDRLYVAGEYGGALLIDVVDPAVPRLIDRWVPDHPVIDLAAHPERVLAVTEDGALWLLPLRADGTFDGAARLPTRSQARRVELDHAGRLAYLGGRIAPVEIIELDCR